MKGNFLFKIVFIFIVIFGMGCQPRSAITLLSLDLATEHALFQRAIFSADDPFSFREVEEASFEQDFFPYVDEQGNAVVGNALPELSREQLDDYFDRAWPSSDPIYLIENDSETFYQNFINWKEEPTLSKENIDIIRSMVEVDSQDMETSFVVPSEVSKIVFPAEFPLNYFFSDFPFWGDLLNIESTSFESTENEVWHISNSLDWSRYRVEEWSALNIINDSTGAWPQYLLFTRKQDFNETPVLSDDFEELRILLAYDERGFLKQLLAMDYDRDIPSYNEPLLVYVDFLYDERETLVGINEWDVSYESDQRAVPQLAYRNYRYLHD